MVVDIGRAMSMFAPLKCILPMTIIRRQRLMPVAGKVLVRAGQKVSATDTIAESNPIPEYLMLDIARGLGVPVNDAVRYLKCQVGEHLAEKDILAGPVGLGRRVVRSPRSGTVVVISDGQMLLEISNQPHQMKAGLPGEVVELIPDHGVVIESAGALIQGVWGNDRVDAGQLSVFAKTPDQEIVSSDLDVTSRGLVILAGYCQDPQVFKTVEELVIHGLVLGSMEASLIPLATSSPVPVIVLEGFGKRPIGPASYKLLASLEGRDVAINTENWNVFTGVKPEIFFPAAVPSTVAPAPDLVPLEINQKVRIVRPPFAGATGVVEEIKGITSFPSGLRARAALVRLETGEKTVTPLANLEVLA
jgi:hypothetical protein